jgi:hypothetical protein
LQSGTPFHAYQGQPEDGGEEDLREDGTPSDHLTELDQPGDLNTAEDEYEKRHFSHRSMIIAEGARIYNSVKHRQKNPLAERVQRPKILS